MESLTLVGELSSAPLGSVCPDPRSPIPDPRAERGGGGGKGGGVGGSSSEASGPRAAAFKFSPAPPRPHPLCLTSHSPCLSQCRFLKVDWSPASQWAQGLGSGVQPGGISCTRRGQGPHGHLSRGRRGRARQGPPTWATRVAPPAAGAAQQLHHISLPPCEGHRAALSLPPYRGGN